MIPYQDFERLLEDAEMAQDWYQCALFVPDQIREARGEYRGPCSARETIGAIAG